MSEHVNVYEAKSHFSHWLEEAQAGREVVICKRNKPVALLTSIYQPGRAERRFGMAKGSFSLPSSFFDPLPEDLSDLFEGREP
ncbi:MAG: type II toxin-antitoxin system Phd/YefM family antitoxin [Spirochaetota bacterium]